MARSARVLAFAKINLSLKVLGKRSDGYHELRTILHTISLADRLEITWTRSRRSRVDARSSVTIEDNLAARAARLALDAMKATGTVEIALEKHVPIGAGLGGGSSDAAAVLMALPVLAGKRLDLHTLLGLAEQLGSDVPFFLLGGVAFASGRGEELYPLTGGVREPALLVVPDIHVSTAEAYRALRRPALTSAPSSRMMNSFRSLAWGIGERLPAASWAGCCENDFEGAVFRQHPVLQSIKDRLGKLGAEPALMTGSGSALFGLFRNRERARRAMSGFSKERVYPVSLVSRDRYRSAWRRSLAHIAGPGADQRVWPPRSWYAQ